VLNQQKIYNFLKQLYNQAAKTGNSSMTIALFFIFTQREKIK